MTSVQAMLLGAVQGVTEFLPVSSSAHVMIFAHLAMIPCQGKEFCILLNLGTLLAITVFFWEEMINLLRGSFDFLLNRKTENCHFFLTIFLSSLPTVIVFGVLRIIFDVEVTSINALAGSMIFFGCILYFCDRRPISNVNISRKDSLLIGLVQPLSFVPGVSRLGICLSMMRWLKYSREECFRHCMILSTMPTTGACILELIHMANGGEQTVDLTTVAAGSGTAFLFGLVSLNFISFFLRKHSFFLVVIYKIVFGAYIFLFN
ncbi:MAG: undecaprenyl-diphosphate phosphatase [Holosporaceae bacterium]|nr:undecaprenyl-diphosphate phosphatase [Holosporaceae bacterium]